jgi:NAD(P)-dependent dehydrogenase (short-subunit alcohol dehydrogenase family)
VRDPTHATAQALQKLAKGTERRLVVAELQ